MMTITVDKGLLVIAGGRKIDGSAGGEHTAVYDQERFKGSFRRMISLPDDAEAGRISANCRDGMLCVTVPGREASRPRQISIN